MSISTAADGENGDDSMVRKGAERGVDEGEFMRNVEWNPKRKV
jgi:hypothetical protein